MQKRSENSRSFCTLCFLITVYRLWHCMRCFSLVVFAFHFLCWWCFLFIADRCMILDHQLESERLYLYCYLACYSGDGVLGGTTDPKSSSEVLWGLSFLTFFCTYRAMLQLLVIASAFEALVNVLALLRSQPLVLLLATHSHFVLALMCCSSVLSHFREQIQLKKWNFFVK